MEEEDGHLSLGRKVRCGRCNGASLSVAVGFMLKPMSVKFARCFSAKRRMVVIDGTFQLLRKQRLFFSPLSADFYVDLMLFFLSLFCKCHVAWVPLLPAHAVLFSWSQAAQREQRPKTQQQPAETAPTAAAVGPGGPRRQAAPWRGGAR